MTVEKTPVRVEVIWGSALCLIEQRHMVNRCQAADINIPANIKYFEEYTQACDVLFKKLTKWVER